MTKKKKAPEPQPTYPRWIVDCWVVGCGWSKVGWDTSELWPSWQKHVEERHPDRCIQPSTSPKAMQNPTQNPA